MRSLTRLMTSANLMALAMLCSSPGGAQSTTPPALQANESIVKTGDGCGFVVPADSVRYVEKEYAASVWGGTCIEGLAMGEGTLFSITSHPNYAPQQVKGWALWGRPIGYVSIAKIDGSTQRQFHWDGQLVDVSDWQDGSARWPAEQKEWDDQPVVYRMLRVGSEVVFARKSSCILTPGGRPRDCSEKKRYGVFEVTSYQLGNAAATQKRMLCPNPRTPKDCDAVWQQMANPLIERGKALVAQNEAKAEALQREMPTLIASAQAVAHAAAEKREAEARKLAAAEAAEAARLDALKDAEERQYKRMLAQGNPGQLFTLADRLSTEGKTDEAREVRRTLISRFPDHALAATAATQLAGGDSIAGASPAAGVAAKFGSVCERNWEKILAGVEARGIRQSGYNDLWIRDFNWYAAKVFEPCVGTSAEAARQYQNAMDGYNRINNHCAGPHEAWECLPWGTGGGISDNGGTPYNNPAYYAGWKADVDRALADPNYSAELGAASRGSAVNAAEAACDAGLKDIKSQFNAAQKAIPQDSVVVRSEAILWMTEQSIARIDAQCPLSATFRAQSKQLQATRDSTRRTCNAMSTSGECQARLPGREPAAATPQRVAEKKPLAQPPPTSCDEGTGANWLKCKQEACARMDGKLENHQGGCVTCYAPGGNANWCPAGGGYNSAQ